MGSSSHGGERKGQLGPAVTVPMSGTHLKRDEGWDPIIKGVPMSGTHLKRDEGWGSHNNHFVYCVFYSFHFTDCKFFT